MNATQESGLYPMVLVSGNSGSGKTYLSELAARRYPQAFVLDLDWIGVRGLDVGSSDTLWLVLKGSLLLLNEIARHRPVVAFGTCRNVASPAEFRWPVDPRFAAWKPDKNRIRRADAVSSVVPWSKCLWMWYQPTEEQIKKRFGTTRSNNYGKDPHTRAEVMVYLEKIGVNGPPAGFELIDVTVMDPGSIWEHVDPLIPPVQEGP